VLPRAALEAPLVASACCVFKRRVGVSCVLLYFIFETCGQCSASLFRALDSITLLSLLLSWPPHLFSLSTFM
jgi:hypothetical protein